MWDWSRVLRNRYERNMLLRLIHPRRHDSSCLPACQFVPVCRLDNCFRLHLKLTQFCTYLKDDRGENYNLRFWTIMTSVMFALTKFLRLLPFPHSAMLHKKWMLESNNQKTYASLFTYVVPNAKFSQVQIRWKVICMVKWNGPETWPGPIFTEHIRLNKTRKL
jgi:hypothetical protein